MKVLLLILMIMLTSFSEQIIGDYEVTFVGNTSAWFTVKDGRMRFVTTDNCGVDVRKKHITIVTSNNVTYNYYTRYEYNDRQASTFKFKKDESIILTHLLLNNTEFDVLIKDDNGSSLMYNYSADVSDSIINLSMR